MATKQTYDPTIIKNYLDNDDEVLIEMEEDDLDEYFFVTENIKG